jgi:hypothetical protein
MRSLLFVERIDLRPSKQYILVRVIPSCFRFSEINLCQVSVLARSNPRYFAFSSWGVLRFLIKREHVSLRDECDVHRLDPLVFIIHIVTNLGLQPGRFAVSVKQWLDHCPWLVLQCRRPRLVW